MGIEIHDAAGIVRMGRAGQVARATLRSVVARLEVGVTTGAIDAWVREDTTARGGTPSQLGYQGFPAAVCVSPNEVVCHGIPSSRRLSDGDIVNVDVTTCLDGYHGDTSVTVAIGRPSPEAQHVMRVAERCLWAGISAVRPGGRLGDVGAAVEVCAKRAGCGVVREYGGHGIGRAMHMAPHVSHFGRAGRGVRLRPGMTFTIEPMVTLGEPGVRLLDDGWTVVTCDGTPSAQFEHTVLVTKDGVQVLTADPE